MRFQTYVIPILIALAMAVNIPNIGLAQDTQPAQAPSQTGVQAPQPKGGVATVIGVDQPDNCLRIRSGPGNQYRRDRMRQYGRPLEHYRRLDIKRLGPTSRQWMGLRTADPD